VVVPGVVGVLTPVPDELPALPIESVPVVPGVLEGEPMPGVLSVGLPGVDGLAAPGAGVVGLAAPGAGVVGLTAPGVLPVP
jgi:hypothetical protein